MISGIFENCIGTTDAAAALKYWAELGYKPIQQGQLSAEQAELLYQHPAALTSWRLQNGDSATHGLVRVMLWSQPRNAGLGKTLPMVVGSRWFASLTQDIYTIDAQRLGRIPPGPPKDFPDLLGRINYIVGSPATVAQQLNHYIAATQVDSIGVKIHLPGLPNEVIRRSMKLFAFRGCPPSAAIEAKRASA